MAASFVVVFFAGSASALVYNLQSDEPLDIPVITAIEKTITGKNNNTSTDAGASPEKEIAKSTGNGSPQTKKPAADSATPTTGGTSAGVPSAPPSSGTGGGSNTPEAPAAPISYANEKFGMAAPADKWNERLAQVGREHINYRRIFLVGFDDGLNKVTETLNAGMTPVISWKTTPYSWAQVGSGAADSALRSLVSRLNAIPGNKILVLHHEPAKDGTANDFVAMQLRALPILKTANNVQVGIIANGWWWSAQNHGYNDSEIAQWIPTSLKNVCDFIAADTYQEPDLSEDGSVRALRLAAWARRTGGVSALGIGEFNGYTAASITNVMNVVKADPLFKWALVWNSGPTGLGTPLEGDRLNAFINGKSTPNPT